MMTAVMTIIAMIPNVVPSTVFAVIVIASLSCLQGIV